MSLASRIQTLAARIADEINTVRTEVEGVSNAQGDLSTSVTDMYTELGPASSQYDPILKGQVFS